MEGCSPICIHFWVVISKLITLAALLKFPVTLSLFWKQMNQYFILVLRENWVLWLFLCHMTGLRVGQHFPEPIKGNRYLVPVGCVCPCGGSYLSSSWGMGLWPCWCSVCGAQVLCHSPAKEWGLAACLLWVVITVMINWYALHSTGATAHLQRQHSVL